MAGFFDPILASHAGRLRQIRDAEPSAAAVAVVLFDPEDPLLPGPARAELVAALKSVDHVILPGPESADLLTLVPEELLFHEMEADKGRRLDLMRRVHGRSSA